MLARSLNRCFLFGKFQTANHSHHVSSLMNQVCFSTTTTPPSQEPNDLPQDKASANKSISKAMQIYLERAREHEEFMKQQTQEYQIGKRHLANMMGEDPETFTQEDINNAIQYLFPSGLFEKKARPFMKPPEEVFPERKAAEFDETGRPYHFLFYTARPNFNKVLFDIVEHINELNSFEDAMARKKLQPDPNLTLRLTSSYWIDKESLEQKLLETIVDAQYENFVAALERLLAHPYSYRVKDFIMTYKKQLVAQTKTTEIPAPQYDTDGRAYITTYECLRKRARGHVTLRAPGKGLISINGQDLNYFKDTQSREQICQDTIKTNLLEHMKTCSGRHQLLDDIENKNTLQEKLSETFRGASKFEINISFLWAAFVKRWDLLDGFLGMGAQLEYYEPNQGLAALHLAAFSGCIPGTQFLISRGMDVNACWKCYTPLHCAAFGDSPDTAMILLNNGAKVSALTSNPSNCNESVLHCAVRANAVACVRLFTAEGADVGQVEYSGMSPIHLAGDLGHSQCLKVMLEAKGNNVNAKTRERELTALHLAAEGGYVECIEFLLEKGADANARNHRGQTPLHLAARAQSLDCVEMLLKKGNADPNTSDFDKRTPLHAAVGKAARSYDIIEVLVSWGAEVNTKDQYGYAPLHIAALNELSQCVEVLIFHGADVTAKSKFGMTALGIMTRKTPASLAMINHKLDSAITLHHHPEASNREVEMRLDFRIILQNCHPREISFLNAFVDEGQKEILLHPLCSAFLYLKWEKIRKYYIARMVFCFVFVLALSLYVLTALAHNCYNHGKNTTDGDDVIELCEKKSIMGHMLRNNPFVIEMQWFVLVGITVWEILRKVYGLAGYPTLRQYVSYPENIIEWFVIVSVFVISFIYTGRTHIWQNHVGAFAVLLGWTNLMLMVGQLPIFGSYVAMYTRVLGEFAKLLLAYSCLLIGFGISFCVIFPDSNTFANPFIGLITVLVMMTGELNLDLLVDDDPDDPPFLLEVSAQVTFVLFLLFVTVILMNLLVGIAVHDIQGLQKTAGLSKLVRQTKLISYIELALFNGYLPKYFLNLLHLTALVSPKAYRVVLNVKPLNPREKRLPREILNAAYEIARLRKNYGHTISSQGSTATSYYTIKKRFNNNTDTETAMGDNPTTMNNFQNKFEESTRQIECLNEEIRELKVAMKQTHCAVEQLMLVIKQKNDGATGC